MFMGLVGPAAAQGLGPANPPQQFQGAPAGTPLAPPPAAYPAPPGQVLPPEIGALLAKHNLNPERVSIYVQEVGEKQPLVSLNADTPRNPASVAKLLTTGAGISALGEQFRWKTNFYLDELPDANGVSHGNLYIQGSGDPYLVQERLWEALQAMRNKGLREITGNIVLDDGAFRLSQSEQDGGSFDGAEQSAYNAVPNALMVNFRTIDIYVGNGVRIEPNITSWKIVNRVQRTKGKCGRSGISANLERAADGSAQLVLSGRLGASCPEYHIKTVLGEGSEVFYYWFRDYWLKLGGTAHGVGQVQPIPPGKKLFHTLESVALPEAIAMMNQHSNNVMTRHLFLTLSQRRPATLVDSRQAVLQILQKMGVNTQNMFLDNGAGLSRRARVSARQIVQLLQALAHNYHFIQSLAVSGEVGTLKRRFRGEALQGRIHAKTGTLRNIHSLAGYLESASNRTYLFAIIVENAGRGLENDLLRWLYNQ